MLAINKTNHNTKKWKDANDEPCPPPFFVETLGDALWWYGSVYNSENDGGVGPTLGLPSQVLGNPVYCVILSAASSAAGKRTKEQLSKMRNCYDFDVEGNNFWDEIVTKDPQFAEKIGVVINVDEN